MPAKIYPAAKERLLEIWDYTERTWGVEQADKYLRGLVAFINTAATDRSGWRPIRDAGLPGVFFVRFEHHYVFFRELSNGTLGVISVLHENMDIPNRLRQDSERESE